MQVSRLGFGCGGLSGIYNAPLTHEEGILMIKQAFNSGITFFDTSDLYGDNYDNEIMIGKVSLLFTNFCCQIHSKLMGLNNKFQLVLIFKLILHVDGVNQTLIIRVKEKVFNH